jgi:hypothetical protein
VTLGDACLDLVRVLHHPEAERRVFKGFAPQAVGVMA